MAGQVYFNADGTIFNSDVPHEVFFLEGYERTDTNISSLIPSNDYQYMQLALSDIGGVYITASSMALSSRVIRSIDSGQTYTSEYAPSNRLFDIACDATGQYVYTYKFDGTPGGIYRNHNYGTGSQWHFLDSGITSGYGISVSPSGQYIVQGQGNQAWSYVTNDGYVYSDDYGSTWSNIWDYSFPNGIEPWTSIATNNYRYNFFRVNDTGEIQIYNSTAYKPTPNVGQIGTKQYDSTGSWTWREAEFATGQGFQSVWNEGGLNEQGSNEFHSLMPKIRLYATLVGPFTGSTAARGTDPSVSLELYNFVGTEYLRAMAVSPNGNYYGFVTGTSAVNGEAAVSIFKKVYTP